MLTLTRVKPADRMLTQGEAHRAVAEGGFCVTVSKGGRPRPAAH